jgi:hypothetical protein
MSVSFRITQWSYGNALVRVARYTVAMPKKVSASISASLALSALEDASQEVRDAEEVLRRARANRDELIRDARANSIPYPVLTKRTGLGREHLSKIANSADTHSV